MTTTWYKNLKIINKVVLNLKGQGVEHLPSPLAKHASHVEGPIPKISSIKEDIYIYIYDSIFNVYKISFVLNIS